MTDKQTDGRTQGHSKNRAYAQRRAVKTEGRRQLKYGKRKAHDTGDP